MSMSVHIYAAVALECQQFAHNANVSSAASSAECRLVIRMIVENTKILDQQELLHNACVTLSACKVTRARRVNRACGPGKHQLLHATKKSDPSLGLAASAAGNERETGQW